MACCAVVRSTAKTLLFKNVCCYLKTRGANSSVLIDMTRNKTTQSIAIFCKPCLQHKLKTYSCRGDFSDTDDCKYHHYLEC